MLAGLARLADPGRFRTSRLRRAQTRSCPVHRSNRGWLEAGKDVYVYYNNDIEGYAVANARELAEAVSISQTSAGAMTFSGDSRRRERP